MVSRIAVSFVALALLLIASPTQAAHSTTAQSVGRVMDSIADGFCRQMKAVRQSQSRASSPTLKQVFQNQAESHKATIDRLVKNFGSNGSYEDYSFLQYKAQQAKNKIDFCLQKTFGSN